MLHKIIHQFSRILSDLYSSSLGFKFLSRFEASENSRKLKKSEAKIRSIRDKQRGFEHTYNQVKEYKTSRNDQKLVDSQQKAEEIRETVRNEQKKEQESKDELAKVNKGVFTNYVDYSLVFFDHLNTVAAHLRAALN